MFFLPKKQNTKRDPAAQIVQQGLFLSLGGSFSAWFVIQLQDRLTQVVNAGRQFIELALHAYEKIARQNNGKAVITDLCGKCFGIHKLLSQWLDDCGTHMRL